MIETNIKTLLPGMDLALGVRCLNVITQDPSSRLLETICSNLRRRGFPAAASKSDDRIFVLTEKPIQPISFEEKNYHVDVRDSGRNQTLRLTKRDERDILTQLIERAVLVEVQNRTGFWRLGSTRIWYEPTPFKIHNGIEAYRRYEISAIFIESAGIGIAVDVSTGFFTTDTVADFFADDISEEEKNKRQKRFGELGQRQKGQKGTLLYELGDRKMKCYFESFMPGMTCTSTGKLPVGEETYDSLYDYYRVKRAYLQISPEDSVAWD